MVHSLRPWLMAALVALPAVSAPSSGFDVRVKEGLVTIDARAAPLSDVLDQLGHQTGMKVVYEAGRPRQIVSAAIEGLPPADALAKLLEGLGVGYGFSLDATGARVETLIISGAAGAAKASLAPSPSHLPLARPV
jgi:type II secretory pathway component GspD/PulD (secretin)